MKDVLRMQSSSLHTRRLQVILSSGCSTIAALRQMDAREGLQLHTTRIFLVQHQLKFWPFQVQNAWGEIIAVQQSPQMWCQEPHQWLSWTEPSCATHHGWPLTEGILPHMAALNPGSCCPEHPRKALAGSARFPHVPSSNAFLKP